ncbi:hypothetical protein PRVXT_001680 [Proteinivorax tanatarense]|uniref:Uncharacterized protein n=1 Tax=Proteinivorax tanatarense TaxID=1260629 RepID=A0AAU7VI47_9FIRM
MTRQVQSKNKNNSKIKLKMSSKLLRILKLTWIPALCVLLFAIGMQVGISYIWEAGSVTTEPVLNSITAIWNDEHEHEVSYSWNKNEEISADVIKERNDDAATLVVTTHEGESKSFELSYGIERDEDDSIIKRYLIVNGEKVRSVEGEEEAIVYNVPGSPIDYNLFSKDMWSGFWQAIKNF